MFSTLALILNVGHPPASPVHADRPLVVNVVNQCQRDLHAGVVEDAKGEHVVKLLTVPAGTSVVVELDSQLGLRIELLHGAAIYRSSGDPDHRRELVVDANCDAISSTTGT